MNETSFDARKETGLLLGRFQPWHAGHQALAEEVIRRIGQVCIQVRLMPEGFDNPFPYEVVRQCIDAAMHEQEGKFMVVPGPNITTVFHGRDTGWDVQQIELPPVLQEVSATEIRRQLRLSAMLQAQKAPQRPLDAPPGQAGG